MHDGELNTSLEDTFCSMESTVLHRIRKVSRTNAGAAEKESVACLFAIHLVRSPSFKDIHTMVVESKRSDLVNELAADDEIVAKFIEITGRPPDRGELARLAQHGYGEIVEDPTVLADSTIHLHERINTHLNQIHMQIIEVPDDLPGLVLADTSIVHAYPPDKRYGFRDGLGIEAATLMIGPLTRRIAVAFTTRQTANRVFKYRWEVDTLNAIFIRNARSEVACHPDDDKTSRQAFSRRHDNPPERLLVP